jgi:hypothetical protein
VLLLLVLLVLVLLVLGVAGGGSAGGVVGVARGEWDTWWLSSLMAAHLLGGWGFTSRKPLLLCLPLITCRFYEKVRIANANRFRISAASAAPRTEGREQSASGSGTAYSFKGGRDLVLSLSSGLALLSLPLPLARLVGHQIFSACGAAPTLGWPAAQKAESRASGSGTTRTPPSGRA